MSASAYINELVEAHNKMRTQPESFIPILKDKLKKFKGKNIQLPGNVTLLTKEGPSAVREAIKFLQKQSPIGEVMLSEELCNSAQDHAVDLGKNNARGHTGTDGSKLSERIERYCIWGGTAGENISYRAGEAEDVVLRLVVDDGVPGRGHRDNVFNDAFNHVGIGLYDHPTWDNCVVMDYAGSVLFPGGGSYGTPSYGKFKPQVEETKDLEDGFVDINDVPKYLRDQIKEMDLGKNYQIKREGGQYRIIIPSSCGVATADSSPTDDFGNFPTSGSTCPYSKGPSKTAFSKIGSSDIDKFGDFGGFGKSDFGGFESSGSEPSGYTHKSVKTSTRTCGSKTTKTVTTKYTFADGSTQTTTETTTSG